MQALLPVLNQSWERVQYYRQNLDKLDELRVIEKRRKRYIKMNTEFSINNDLIKNKVLFLDTQNPIAPAVVKKSKNFDSKEEASLEFIDDDEPIKSIKPTVKSTIKPTINSTKETVKPTINSTNPKSEAPKTVKTKKKIKAESDKEDDGKYENKQEDSKKPLVNIPVLKNKTINKTEIYEEPELEFID